MNLKRWWPQFYLKMVPEGGSENWCYRVSSHILVYRVYKASFQPIFHGGKKRYIKANYYYLSRVQYLNPQRLFRESLQWRTILTYHKQIPPPVEYQLACKGLLCHFFVIASEPCFSQYSQCCVLYFTVLTISISYVSLQTSSPLNTCYYESNIRIKFKIKYLIKCHGF